MTDTVTVTVLDDRPSPADPVEPGRWRELARCVLVEEGQVGELDLTFVDEGAIADLNAAHLGREGPTDVLSFPLDGAPGESAAVGVPRLLGDVVICPAVARAGAERRGVAVDDELALLVVHGVLHVLGWDHGTDAEQAVMQARERHHLDRWRATSAQPTGRDVL